MIKSIALGLLALLGLFDVLLVMACGHLEKDRTIEDEEQAKYLADWREKHGTHRTADTTPTRREELDYGAFGGLNGSDVSHDCEDREDRRG